MQDMTPTERNALPTGEILINAFKGVWEDRRDFIAMAALPIFALAIVNAATHFYFPGEIMEMNEEGVPVRLNPGVFINSVVMILFYVMFAVAWHRHCLLSDLSVTVGTALKWDVSKMAFLFRLLGIFGIIILLLIPLSLVAGLLGQAISSIAIFAMMLVALLAFSRLVLVLPATAIKEPISYKQAWEITKGNSWRMLLIYMVPSIPVSLVQIVVVVFLANLLNSMNGLETLTGKFIVNLIQELIAYVGVAVGVAALSGAYKFFRENAN